MLAQLAREEDVTELNIIYQQLLQRTDDDDEPVEVHALDELRIEDVFSGAADLGVEKESLLTREQLEYELSFPDGRPVVFNDRIHRNGLTAWKDQDALKDAQLDLLDDLRLQWHQLVGIRAMARMSFSAGQGVGLKSGILVADEVGLGKTAQQMGFNAFVNQEAEMQVLGNALSPAIGEFSSFWFLVT